MKPYKEIYDIANLHGYDILFIDDREINLDYPKELGWKTYLFKGNNEEAKRIIEDFLNE